MVVMVAERPSVSWRCRLCRKVLGVLSETHLVIAHGRTRLHIPRADAGHVVRWCERCGAANRLGDFTENCIENG